MNWSLQNFSCSNQIMPILSRTKSWWYLNLFANSINLAFYTCKQILFQWFRIEFILCLIFCRLYDSIIWKYYCFLNCEWKSKNKIYSRRESSILWQMFCPGIKCRFNGIHKLWHCNFNRTSSRFLYLEVEFQM